MARPVLDDRDILDAALLRLHMTGSYNERTRRWAVEEAAERLMHTRNVTLQTLCRRIYKLLPTNPIELRRRAREAYERRFDPLVEAMVIAQTVPDLDDLKAALARISIVRESELPGLAPTGERTPASAEQAERASRQNHRFPAPGRKNGRISCGQEVFDVQTSETVSCGRVFDAWTSETVSF